MIIRSILAEILKYSLFFVSVAIINYFLCVYLETQLVDEVIEFQLFLFLLFGIVGVGTKMLNISLPDNGLGITLGAVGIKMIAAITYVMPKLLKNRDHQEYLALFFVVNYLLYLSYSIFRIVKKRY